MGATNGWGALVFFEPSVLDVELIVAQAGIICATQELHAERIFIKGDSTTIIKWIQDEMKMLEAHPLHHDILSSSMPLL